MFKCCLFRKSTRQVNDQFKKELKSRDAWKSKRVSFSNKITKIYPIKENCSLCHFYGVCSNCDLTNKKI